MNIERELWGEISKDLFNDKLEEFTDDFGKPKQVRRLALRFGPDDAHYINTRIRITNGDAKIMQKIHDTDRNSAKEFELDIKNDAVYIVELLNTYRTILKHFENTHCYLLRFENSLFSYKGVEVKLTHQFGNEEIYSFEVEAFDENVNVEEECGKLDLPPNLEATTDEFWIEFNKRANIDVMDWEDEKLIDVINKFLEK